LVDQLACSLDISLEMPIVVAGAIFIPVIVAKYLALLLQLQRNS